ncbi:hypothetical protein [Mucilaginibacter sp. UYCu711]|uniref:hypothetical protein n=1 Tax=Mucilaginibacter sp. UYCu711 TaxID=3156339 RepID=UPI003D254D88
MSKKRVVYVILSARAGMDRLVYNILPELETGMHHFEVAGICLFDENAQLLNSNESVGRRLVKLSDDRDITLMIAEKKDMTGCTVSSSATLGKRLTPVECPVITVAGGEHLACFPDIYAAIGTPRPDHIISL